MIPPASLPGRPARCENTGRIASSGRENPVLRAACPAPAARPYPLGDAWGRPTAIPIPSARRSGTTVRSKVAVVHNGIINYKELRERLEAHGYTFCSETDTKPSHLVDYLHTGNRRTAAKTVLAAIFAHPRSYTGRGFYGQSEEIVAARGITR